MAYAPAELTGAVKAYLKRMLTESGVVRASASELETLRLIVLCRA